MGFLHMDGMSSFARQHNDAIAREQQRLFDILHPGHQTPESDRAKHRERVTRWAKKASDFDLEWEIKKPWNPCNSQLWKEVAETELANRRSK